jgi:beta-glucanase (GH16 family)
MRPSVSAFTSELIVRIQSYSGGVVTIVALCLVSCSSGASSTGGSGGSGGGGAHSGAGAGGALGNAGSSATGGATSQAGASSVAGASGNGGASTGGGGAGGGLAGGAGGSGGTPTTAESPDPTDLTKWTLVWSDEFNAPDGTAPDATKWTREENAKPPNNEEEYYTTSDANSTQSGGNLVITALKQQMGDQSYTSGRINSLGHYSIPYGRVEARAKMPTGQGMWPAFWMLGDNINNQGWPKCGEIDIMETVGSDIETNHGSLHGPGPGGASYNVSGSLQLPGKVDLSKDFHVYAAEWAENSVKFFVDDTLYETRTPADLSSDQTWEFNHPFFIVINLAVGGSWPGSPNDSTQFPAQLLVDYVRVYAPKM